MALSRVLGLDFACPRCMQDLLAGVKLVEDGMLIIECSRCGLKTRGCDTRRSAVREWNKQFKDAMRRRR